MKVMSVNKSQSCAETEPFALQVTGEDMLPEFRPGHIVVVDPGGVVRDGCFAVIRNGQEWVLRQLELRSGTCFCKALNGPHSGDDGVDEVDMDRIVGVVSQRRGIRRSQLKRYDQA